MRETGLGKQQEEIRKSAGSLGRSGPLGGNSWYLGEFPGGQALRGRREIRFLDLREAAGRGTGSILEAELVKNRDLAQPGSNVFMNGMGEVQGLCFWTSRALALSLRYKQAGFAALVEKPYTYSLIR